MKTDNELIAEFMGGLYSTHADAWGFGNAKIIPLLGNYKNVVQAHKFEKELRYDISWDWLMPVVEKIETMSYRTSISTYSTLIERVSKDGDPIIYFPTSSGDSFKREATYKAVVDFIKWHNEQKQ